MRALSLTAAVALTGCFPVFGEYGAPAEGGGGSGEGGGAAAGGAAPGLSIAWHTTLEAQRPVGIEVEPALHVHGVAVTSTDVVVVGALRGALGASAAPSERPLIGHVGEGGLVRSRVYDVTGSTDRRGGALLAVSTVDQRTRAVGTFHGTLTSDAGDTLEGESGSWFAVELDAALSTTAAASECEAPACSAPSTAGLALSPTALLTTRMVPGDPSLVEHLAVAPVDEAGAPTTATLLPRFPCESPNALGLEAAPFAAVLAEGPRFVVASATCAAQDEPRAFVDLVIDGAIVDSAVATGARSYARSAAPTTEGAVIAGDYHDGALAFEGHELDATTDRSVGFVAWVAIGSDGLSVQRVVPLAGTGRVFLTSVVTHQGRVYVAGSSELGSLGGSLDAAAGQGRHGFVVALSHEGELLDGVTFGDFALEGRVADRAVWLASDGQRLAASGPFRGAFEPGGPEATAQASFVLELDPGTSASR